MTEPERLLSIRGEIGKVNAAGGPSYREAVERLRSVLLQKVAEGATLAELAAAFGANGVRVREASLAAFVETGRWPGRIPLRERILAVTDDLAAKGENDDR